MHSIATSPLVLALFATPALAQDFVVPAGTVVKFDTAEGRLNVRSLVVETGGVLRVVGPRPFVVVARQFVSVQGTIDLSGFDSQGVLTLNTTAIPESGAPGAAGGGAGGTGSSLTTDSTPAGLPGEGSGGGGGGETGFHPSSLTDNRRGAGGGGGALARNQPAAPNPDDEANEGLIAEAGRAGTTVGLGAISQSAPPAPGTAGSPVFTDVDPSNDFWGTAVDALGNLTQGELPFPVAGQGGGAGGDASITATFPVMPFAPTGDEKGAGGGGGGGLGLILSARIELLPGGRILTNGGTGGGGENTTFFDRVGGGSGGGSGGFIALEALEFDFGQADDDSLQALGGKGGSGRNDVFDDPGGGGNGGPGVIQVHTLDGTDSSITLPPGKTLDDLSLPDGYILLPHFID